MPDKPRSVRLRELLEESRKKGRVTSTFRDPEHNRKVGGSPTSFHQIQGGAFDIMDLKKKDAERVVGKLQKEGFFSYRNPETGQIHADIGPHASKATRRKAFKKIKKDVTDAKGRFLFGNPTSITDSLKEQIQPTEDRDQIEGTSLIGIGDQVANQTTDLRPRLLDRIRENSKPLDEEEQEKAVRESDVAELATADVMQQKAEGERIIFSQTEQVKEVVKNLPQVDEATAREVSSDIDRKVQGGPRKGGVSSQFTEALTFFLPNIIGAVGGAAIGGIEGMVAGEAKAGELAGSFRDHKLKQAELASKTAKGRQPRLDVTPDFIDKKTGKPIFTKEVDGIPKFIDDQGNIIPSSRARSLKDLQFEKREEGVQERFEGRLEESQVKRLESNLDKFSKQNIKTRDAIQVTEPVINLVQSKVPITSDFLAPFIARGVQNEVGNLSETDLQKARVPLPLFERMKSDFVGFIQGDMTDDERDAVVRLLTFMNEQKKNVIKKNAKGFANKDRAGRVGISAKDLEKQLLDDTGLFNESSTPVQSGLSTEKQLEIIKRIKAKRNK